MRKIRLPLLSAAGCAALALAAPLAFAGHLNPVLHADLDGRAEVSSSGNNAIAGDPRARGEVYMFGIDESPDVLCYTIVGVRRLAELDLAPGSGRAAHIHRGVNGQNGPVVANLAWPQGGQSADCLNGLTQRARFAADVDPRTLIADILRNPQNYYVNVHNSAYPAGAIRGQLAPAQD
ncbi:MAG: CHRD domain-containing protein [Pseudomonadota bacterium]